MSKGGPRNFAEQTQIYEDVYVPIESKTATYQILSSLQIASAHSFIPTGN